MFRFMEYKNNTCSKHTDEETSERARISTRNYYYKNIENERTTTIILSQQAYRLNDTYFVDYHFLITIFMSRLNIIQHILYKDTSTKSIILPPTKGDTS